MSARRVLVVEDDPRVRALCVDILGNLGYAVVAVDDGSLALQEIGRSQPDLIVLDLVMPRARVDGLGLLSRLAGGPASRVPVLVLSAWGDSLAEVISPEVSSAFHIEAVLSKPVSLTTLTREVVRLVGPGMTN